MKFDTIYIEELLYNSDLTNQILKKLAFNHIVLCKNYKEVFNPSNQNFRIQKMNPCLIIAQKKEKLIFRTPEKFTIGYKNNFYFSHMLNCIYDCKYCYLQGMYSSANMVLFINFDDFKKEIEKIVQKTSDSICFFSGYECDSLALDKITNFSNYFINIFKNSSAFLELRTKSINIKSLLKHEANPNTICAIGLNPEEIVEKYELKTASLSNRIDAIQILQKKGWKVGLRFDPLLLVDKYEDTYRDFFKFIFKSIDSKKLHSITLGDFRMPKKYFEKLKKINVDQSYLFDSVLKNNKIYDLNTRCIRDFCYEEIVKYCSNEIVFMN